jgi:hypothetical protein
MRAIPAIGLALVLTGLFASATAQTSNDLARLPRGTVLEGAEESSTELTGLPATVAGKIRVQSCSTCAVKMLSMDSATRFNLGGKRVSLQEMAAYCAKNTHKPLTIHYRLTDSVVSLVSVLEP